MIFALFILFYILYFLFFFRIYDVSYHYDYLVYDRKSGGGTVKNMPPDNIQFRNDKDKDEIPPMILVKGYILVATLPSRGRTTRRFPWTEALERKLGNKEFIAKFPIIGPRISNLENLVNSQIYPLLTADIDILGLRFMPYENYTKFIRAKQKVKRIVQEIKEDLIRIFNGEPIKNYRQTKAYEKKRKKTLNNLYGKRYVGNIKTFISMYVNRAIKKIILSKINEISELLGINTEGNIDIRQLPKDLTKGFNLKTVKASTIEEAIKLLETLRELVNSPEPKWYDDDNLLIIKSLIIEENYPEIVEQLRLILIKKISKYFKKIQDAVAIAYLYDSIKYKIFLDAVHAVSSKAFVNGIAKGTQIEQKIKSEIDSEIQKSFDELKQNIQLVAMSLKEQEKPANVSYEELPEYILESLRKSAENFDENFKFEAIPIQLSPQIFYNYLEESVARIFQEKLLEAERTSEAILKRERSKALRKAREIRESIINNAKQEAKVKAKEILEGTLNSLREKMNDIREALIKIAEIKIRNPDKVVKTPIEQEIKTLSNFLKFIADKNITEEFKEIETISVDILRGNTIKLREHISRLAKKLPTERAKTLRETLSGLIEI